MSAICLNAGDEISTELECVYTLYRGPRETSTVSKYSWCHVLILVGSLQLAT